MTSYGNTYIASIKQCIGIVPMYVTYSMRVLWPEVSSMLNSIASGFFFLNFVLDCSQTMLIDTFHLIWMYAKVKNAMMIYSQYVWFVQRLVSTNDIF